MLHRFIALSLSEYNDANITGSCQSLIRSCNQNSTGLHHIDLSVLDISVVVEIRDWVNEGKRLDSHTSYTLVRCLIKKKCVDKILMPVNLPSQPGLDKI